MDTQSQRAPGLPEDCKSETSNEERLNRTNDLPNDIPGKRTDKTSPPNRPQTQLHASLLNCQSLGKGPLGKGPLLNSHTVDKKLDLFCLTETWLTDKDDTVIAELMPPGYEFKHLPRPGTKRGGGVGLLFRNTLQWSKASSHCFNSFEHLDQTLTCGSSLLHIIIIYRPPNTRFSDFIHDFSTLLESACVSKGRLLLLGDFNIHVDNESDANAQHFKEVLDLFNMKQHVNEKTHKHSHTLDLLITREDDTVCNLSVEDNDISDHFNIDFCLNADKPKKPTNTIQYRKLRDINVEAFKEDIRVSSLHNRTFSCVEAMSKCYNETLSDILDKHAPLITKQVVIHPESPWYSQEVATCRKAKRKAERKWRQTGLHIHKEIFNIERNKLIRTIAKAKKEYISSQIEQSSNSQRSLFKCLDSLRNKGKKVILPDHDNPGDLCDEVVSFFANKVSKIRHLLENLRKNEPLQHRGPDDITAKDTLSNFPIVSESKVRKIIMSSASKSCELDPIPTFLLKECIDVLSPIITNLINLSIKTSHVPSSFKIAAVSPLLKKKDADQNNLQNYRPVSNLPFISKILEKVILSLYTDHKSHNNLTGEFQSAYRKHHSCETALLRIKNDVLETLDKKNCCFLVLLDLSAAFDTVDHPILLKCLTEHYGVTEKAHEWFCSYLTDRKQFVTIKGSHSKEIIQHCNVPQGSVLGPTLFSDYIAPLAKIFRKWNVCYHTYADDTQVYVPFTPGVDEEDALLRLTNCLREVRIWMAQHYLKLNDDKTDFIVFSSEHNKTKIVTTDVTIGESRVAPATTVKNIGAALDNTLSMEQEVKAKCKAAWGNLYCLSKLKRYLSTEQLTTAVIAYVVSKLDQNNSLLFGLPNILLNKLQRIQNAAARLICGGRKYDEASPLLFKLHWLPISFRVEFKVLLLTYKALHGEGPSYIVDLLIPYEPIESLRSSDQHLLVEPRVYSRYGDRAFGNSAPRLWNRLPAHVKDSKTTSAFKSSLKTLLFKRAFSQYL